MFEILHRDWNLRQIFTQKWASVDMNWGEGLNAQPSSNSNTGCVTCVYCVTAETFTTTSGGHCEQLAITWLCHVAFQPCNDLDLDLVTSRSLCRRQCEVLRGTRCRRVFHVARRLLQLSGRLLTGWSKTWYPFFNFARTSVNVHRF